MAVVTDEEIERRIESPMNLFQRMKSITSHTKKEQLIVSIPPRSEDLIPDLDKKLDLASSKSKALSIMNKTLIRLDNEVDSIESRRLPGLVRDMATAIKVMEPEQEKSQNVQFIVYQPQILSEESFGDPIEVSE